MTSARPRVLELSGFGVAFASRRVLSSVDLELGHTGLTALMGPGGTGKSTLARTVCGANASIRYMRTWGTASYDGRPLEDGASPTLVSQRLGVVEHSCLHWLAQTMPNRSDLTQLEQLEQLEATLGELGWAEHARWLESPTIDVPTSSMRRFAIMRALHHDPLLLCVDEPTSGLDDEDANDLLLCLKRLAMTRAVLWVTHHQARAALFSERVALLLDGVIWEEGSTSRFFSDPLTDEARQFVRTGGCSPPSNLEAPGPEPEEDPPELDLSPRAPHPLDALYLRPEGYVRASVGPNGFQWLVPGVLGGAPQPGLLRDLGFDIDALRRVGADHLVTLTEDPLRDLDVFTEHFTVEHFPVVDMRAPTCALAAELCASLDARIARGERVVLHCKAGHGRTGTMLAAHLVWRGLTGAVAVAEARRVERHWIQSDLQIDFLHRFERWLIRHRDEHKPRTNTSSP